MMEKTKVYIHHSSWSDQIVGGMVIKGPVFHIICDFTLYRISMSMHGANSKKSFKGNCGHNNDEPQNYRPLTNI